MGNTLSSCYRRIKSKRTDNTNRSHNNDTTYNITDDTSRSNSPTRDVTDFVKITSQKGDTSTSDHNKKDNFTDSQDLPVPSSPSKVKDPNDTPLATSFTTSATKNVANILIKRENVGNLKLTGDVRETLISMAKGEYEVNITKKDGNNHNKEHMNDTSDKSPMGIPEAVKTFQSSLESFVNAPEKYRSDLKLHFEKGENEKYQEVLKSLRLETQKCLTHLSNAETALDDTQQILKQRTDAANTEQVQKLSNMCKNLIQEIKAFRENDFGGPQTSPYEKLNAIESAVDNLLASKQIKKFDHHFFVNKTLSTQSIGYISMFSKSIKTILEE